MGKVMQSTWVNVIAQFNAVIKKLLKKHPHRVSRQNNVQLARFVRHVVDDEALARSAVDGDRQSIELREEIDWALRLLPAEQREAFLLRHVEQLNYEEMVVITGAGTSALKMRVKRACERLQSLLAEGVSANGKR